MKTHRHTLEAPETNPLSEQDEKFLASISDIPDGVSMLVNKAQEICALCSHIQSVGGVPSETLDVVHHKLHEMVRRKIVDGSVKIVQVDDVQVLALADTDDDEIIAAVRADRAAAELEDIQTAPSTGTLQ